MLHVRICGGGAGKPASLLQPNAIQHDPNGNLEIDPLAPNTGTSVPAGQRYVYDAANRLTAVYRTLDNQLLLEVSYDALGRRVESIEYVDQDGVALLTPKRTWHIFDGLKVIYEEDVEVMFGEATRTPAREFVWGPNFPEPVALIDHTDAGDIPAAGTIAPGYPGGAPPEVLHYLHDVLGSVVGLTDAAGVLVEQYVYDPYGKTYIEDAAGARRAESRYANPFMWTGQRFDGTTGQYHFWARTYSPHLGRWLQRDPLGYVEGVNIYQYVQSSPALNRDPAGLCSGCNPAALAAAGYSASDIAAILGITIAKAEAAVAAAGPAAAAVATGAVVVVGVATAGSGEDDEEGESGGKSRSEGDSNPPVPPVGGETTPNGEAPEGEAPKADTPPSNEQNPPPAPPLTDKNKKKVKGQGQQYEEVDDAARKARRGRRPGIIIESVKKSKQRDRYELDRWEKPEPESRVIWELPTTEMIFNSVDIWPGTSTTVEDPGPDSFANPMQDPHVDPVESGC